MWQGRSNAQPVLAVFGVYEESPPEESPPETPGHIFKETVRVVRRAVPTEAVNSKVLFSQVSGLLGPSLFLTSSLNN